MNRNRKAGLVALTQAQIEHLLYLLENNEREGWYLGRKDYYWKRHKTVQAELNETLKYF